MSAAIYEAAASRAADERRRLGLGFEPVSDMRSLVEQQGALVYSTVVQDGSLSGCFALIAGDVWIMVNSAQTNGRQRFTIAHEYCHSLVDRNLEFVVCTSEKPPHEKFADAFAAAFLMPMESSLAFWGVGSSASVTPEKVVEYCYLFGASYQAAVYRLKNLHIVNSRQVKAFLQGSPFRVAALMGYDLQDPSSPFFMGGFDCGSPVDNYPRAYRTAALRAFDEERISESKLAELLSVDADDLGDLIDPIEVADVPVAW
jgi:Zn-dependent peptidase ImmA (M78 family)